MLPREFCVWNFDIEKHDMNWLHVETFSRRKISFGDDISKIIPTNILTYAHSISKSIWLLIWCMLSNIKVLKKATQDGKKLALPLPGDKSITYWKMG